jgi:hypothetical protein
MPRKASQTRAAAAWAHAPHSAASAAHDIDPMNNLNSPCIITTGKPHREPLSSCSSDQGQQKRRHVANHCDDPSQFPRVSCWRASRKWGFKFTGREAGLKNLKRAWLSAVGFLPYDVGLRPELQHPKLGEMGARTGCRRLLEQGAVAGLPVFSKTCAGIRSPAFF